ncbi:hypothetical protein AtDm6_3044 [Acetobacter tropicalis]|uniref:Uncharacterized protein n=1 Tax=Acetobacter tropicalis TaxID=104102 RepID=A0A095AXD3_9PROT|nr:hypothetical protein AtDm6_3044 [Acetobacter tropicalis]
MRFDKAESSLGGSALFLYTTQSSMAEMIWHEDRFSLPEREPYITFR